MSFKINFVKLFLILLLVCLPAVVTLIFIDDLGNWAFPSNKDSVGEVFKTLLSVYGGLVLFFGLYVSYLRAKEAKRAVDKQTEVIQNQSKEIELSRDSHISEQFKTAIEHLGNDKESVILGGVAELNDVATKYKDRYAEVVTDIFSSYIRSEASISKDYQNIKWSVIQSIVKNLCHNDALKGFPVDLRQSNLSELEISNCHLKDWNLTDSFLPVRMTAVNLETSLLHRVMVLESEYREVNFTDCELINFFIEGGFWKKCKVEGFQDFHPLAVNSSFHETSFLSPLIIGKFISCFFRESDFGTYEPFEVNFSASSFESITFESLLYQCNFNAASFSNVKILGGIEECSFKGARTSTFFGGRGGNIMRLLKDRAETYADLSDLHFPLSEKEDLFLDIKATNDIVDSYNSLISLGGSEEITLPKSLSKVSKR